MPAKTPTTPKTPTGQTPNGSTPQKTGFKPRPGLRLIPPLISIPIFMILLAGGIWLFLDTRDKLDKLAQQQREDNPAPEDYGNSIGHRRAAQRLASTLNTKVNPCDDFHEYSCGKWLKENPIAGYMNGNSFFAQVTLKITNEMDALMKSSVPSSSKAIEKVRLLYKSCLDKSAYESEALQNSINNVNSLGRFPMLDGPSTDKMMDDAMFRMEFLTKVVKKANKEALGLQLFQLGVTKDMKNIGKRIFTFAPPKSVPLYRDVWLNKMKFKKEQDAYRRYLKNMLSTFANDMGKGLSGDVDRQIDDLFELYTGMAKTMASPDDASAMTDHYNMEKFSSFVERFKSKTNIDLGQIYRSANKGPEYHAFITDPNLMVNVAVPRAVDEIAQLFHDTSTDTLINVQLISAFIGSVLDFPEKYGDLELEMEKVVYGKRAKMPRRIICQQTVSNLADAYNALYVRNLFSQETKTKATELVNDLKSSFNEMLDEADWMDKKTKQVAKKKVKEMMVKIGYDLKSLDDKKLDEIYKDLVIEPNMKFLEMDGNMWTFLGTQSSKKFFAPYDKEEHEDVPAADVNAFAAPTANAILIPAAILQAPFFDNDNLAALNYGSIGVFLGHEITHHFDNSGRSFDEIGHLNDWWTPSTSKEYERRAQCMIDQYGAVEVEGLNGIKANGKMTLGENIGDNGGVREAFRAYQKYLAKNGREKLVPGYKLSNEQLFWIGYGQLWCANYREGELKRRAFTDVHSPDKIRTNVVVGNQPEFAKAFKCPKGSPMNPEKKCSVW